MSVELRPDRLSAWSGGLVTALALAARWVNLDDLSIAESEVVYLTGAGDDVSSARHLPEVWLNLDQLTWAGMHLADAVLVRRLVAGAFGALTVLWLWRWIRRRCGALPALIIGLLAAVSPLLVRGSQEIGPYATGTFLAIVAISALDRCLEQPTRRRWIVSGAALAGTAVTWPLLPVVLGPTLALMIEDSRRDSKRADPPRQWRALAAPALLVLTIAVGAFAARSSSAEAASSPPQRPRWTFAAMTQGFEELTLGAAAGAASTTTVGTVALVLALLGGCSALRTNTGRAILCGAFAGTVGIEAVLWFHPDPPAIRHLLGAHFVLLLVALGILRVASAAGRLTEAIGLRRVASAAGAGAEVRDLGRVVSTALAMALLATVLTAESSRLWRYYTQSRVRWDWIASVVGAVATGDDEIVTRSERVRLVLIHYLRERADLARRITVDDAPLSALADRAEGCTLVIEQALPLRKFRDAGHWVQVAADAATGARVLVSAGPRRSDCVRTAPLALRLGPSRPLRWMRPASRRGAPGPVLEFDAASRPYMVRGWSRLESAEGKTYAWVEGRHATLDLDLPGGDDQLLILDLWPFTVPGREQGIEIQVNGVMVTSASLEPGGERMTVEIPAALLREGDNRFDFAFRYAARRRPASHALRDPRRLSAAFDRLELRRRTPAASAGAPR